MAASLDDVESALTGQIAGLLGNILQKLDAVKPQSTSNSGKASKGASSSAVSKAALGAVAALGVFAAALNPAVMGQFNTAVKDLHATIGQAAVPMFQVLTGVVGDVAGAISPLAQQLAPILSNLATALGSVLVPVVTALANVLSVVFHVLEPFIRIFTDVAQILGVMLQVVAVLVKAFVEFLGSLLGGKANELADQFHEAAQKIANAILIFSGMVMKMLGMDQALNDLISGLERQSRGVRAAGQSSFSGFGDVAKQIALNASQSGLGGQAAQNKLDLSEAVSQLKAINGTTSEIARFLNATTQAGGKVASGAQSLWDSTGGTFARGVRRIWKWDFNAE